MSFTTFVRQCLWGQFSNPVSAVYDQAKGFLCMCVFLRYCRVRRPLLQSPQHGCNVHAARTCAQPHCLAGPMVFYSPHNRKFAEFPACKINEFTHTWAGSLVWCCRPRQPRTPGEVHRSVASPSVPILHPPLMSTSLQYRRCFQGFYCDYIHSPELFCIEIPMSFSMEYVSLMYQSQSRSSGKVSGRTMHSFAPSVLGTLFPLPT